MSSGVDPLYYMKTSFLLAARRRAARATAGHSGAPQYPTKHTPLSGGETYTRPTDEQVSRGEEGEVSLKFPLHMVWNVVTGID